MASNSGRTPLRVWVLSLVALAVGSLAMLAVRHDLDKVHVTLVYLLIVLGASAAGGRVLGFTIAVAAFVLFDALFLPPYATLAIGNPLDWLVLVAFLVTSLVAAQLLSLAQHRADEARRHAAEVERLAALGAETLNAARPDEALVAIADVIREALTLDCCEIYLRRGDAPDGPDGTRAPLERLARAGAACAAGAAAGGGTLTAWVDAHDAPAVERSDGTTHVAPPAPGARPSVLGGAWPLGSDARALLLPLRVHGRTVGVLRVARTPALTLREDQRQFLDALAYYAALGVERFRLAAEAAHAAALREADRLKNALLAAVSHDLRTPLTTITVQAHAIAEQGAPAGDARAMSIAEESDRLSRVVGDLLELSRLTGGALRLRPEINAAEDLIGAVRRRVAGIAQGHELRVTAPSDAPVLLGRFDFVHALRALGNLVENAIRYAPAGSPIDLGVASENDMLVFSVADRGPGVPDAERTRIFEPFYRPPGGPPDVGGVGLGLTIARGLATAQGGDVRFLSRAGGGSVFELRLPAASPVAAPDHV